MAECNLGASGWRRRSSARLDAIASRTWLRTLDDRLGISQGGRKRHQEAPSPLPLPRVAARRQAGPISSLARARQPRPDTTHGLQGAGAHPPYNRGRYKPRHRPRHLTEEERYKINEHIIQTIRMLGTPSPPLRKVPEIAGAITSGWTARAIRASCRGQMSIPARIMAIADIFEALDASDRPYKSAKRSPSPWPSW